MLYCFDNTLNFDYSKKEMAIAKKNKNGILYDPSLKSFIDYDGNKVDISGQLLFPRTGSTQIYSMNNEIIKHGGKAIITNEEIDMIKLWPKYVETYRKIEILKGKDLINPTIIAELEKNYGNEIFFKTKEKNFHDIISIDLLKEPKCAFYKTLSHHLDDEFIISEKVNIVRDKLGAREYRCFVSNNQLINISRMTTKFLHAIEPNILNSAEDIIKKLNNNFPKYYCLDIFEYEKDGERRIDVVEFNPIHASGLYLYNSVMNKSADLLHTNNKKISMEFIDTIDECLTEGEIILDSGNKYDVQGSFANDLKSICLTGELGLWVAFIEIDSSDYSRCEGIFGNAFSSDSSIITSDSQLSTLESPGIPIEEAIEKFNKLIKTYNNNH